jgi:hypothetical protein
MAKTKGPLHAQTATGTFSGLLTFSTHRGRPTVRKLTKGANPRSPDQREARLAMMTANLAAKWTKASTMTGPARLEPDLFYLKLNQAPGITWNTTLARTIIGKDQINWDACDALWLALTQPQRDAWDAAASGLTPPIPPLQPPPLA